MSNIMSCDEWIDELDQKVEKMPRVQSRLANFEILPRLGKLLEDKYETCSECRVYWIKLQESTVSFEAFFDDGNDHLIQFENVVGEVIEHLKLVHGIRPKGLILSYKTVYAMIIGLVFGLLIGLFNPDLMKASLILGWLIGTLSGWFWGKVVEKKMHKQNLIF